MAGSPFARETAPLFAGPWDELPNDNEGGGGWVGMDTKDTPVYDTYGLLLLLAIGYGVIRRKRKPLNPLKGTWI